MLYFLVVKPCCVCGKDAYVRVAERAFDLGGTCREWEEICTTCFDWVKKVIRGV